LVSHEDGLIHKQSFYNGTKESERPCLINLLTPELASRNITLDALHLTPKLVNHIVENKGTYLIGIKENQKELLQEAEFIARSQSYSAGFSSIDTKRGRIDRRTYQGYNLKNPYLDDRWHYANFRTIIKVERLRYNKNYILQSSETAYYISNQALNQNQDDIQLFQAIRNHWVIEANNYIRDVTLREDDLKTKIPEVSKNMSLCRTCVLNLITLLKPKNIKAKLEEFEDNFEALLDWLKKIKFL
jgi:predicted transposase YbfD/YdcC